MTNAADTISVPPEMIHDLKFAFDHTLILRSTDQAD
jgi:hypothetical protein